jgi:uncharacterized damage-inducible protein DinB
MTSGLKPYLAKMFRYAAWADRRTLEALRAAPGAHGEAIPILAHLLAAEHLWLARLEQREARHPVWPALEMEECAALLEENDAGYRNFMDRLVDDQLAATVRFRTTQGHDLAMPIVEILTQVITHGPYHRGQIAKIIGRSGGTAINTDYFMFVLEAEPAG